jgi:hypothetical protein
MVELFGKKPEGAENQIKSNQIRLLRILTVLNQYMHSLNIFNSPSAYNIIIYNKPYQHDSGQFMDNERMKW